MKLKSGFVLEEVGGSYLAVAVGERAEEFKVLIKLNSTGAFLWRILESKDVTESDLVNELISEYQVDETTASSSISSFVKTLADGGLLDG